MARLPRGPPPTEPEPHLQEGPDGLQCRPGTVLSFAPFLALASIAHRKTAHWLLAIGAFVLGTIVSGMTVQQSTLKLGRRYDVALTLESLLLFTALPFLEASNSMGLYLASIAMGLQNGMVSAYSGAIIRTTHVTGVFTDLRISPWVTRCGALPVDTPRLRRGSDSIQCSAAPRVRCC